MSCSGLGRRAPGIIWGYHHTTAIVIWPLTQPLTCKMGSSIFAAMSRLKSVSTTRVYFPSMPSTERTNGEKCFRCLWKFLPCLYLFYFPQQSRIVPIGSFLWDSRSGSSSITLIIYSVWLPISPGLGRHLSSPTHSYPGVPPLMIFCGPVRLGVFAYTVRGEVLSCEVDDIINNLVMMCDGYPSVSDPRWNIDMWKISAQNFSQQEHQYTYLFWKIIDNRQHITCK